MERAKSWTTQLYAVVITVIFGLWWFWPFIEPLFKPKELDLPLSCMMNMMNQLPKEQQDRLLSDHEAMQRWRKAAIGLCLYGK